MRDNIHPDLIKGEGIKIKGRIGTWYVIDREKRDGELVWVLEHEFYGDMADILFVDSRLNVVDVEVHEY
jgi:hypothetical protein